MAITTPDRPTLRHAPPPRPRPVLTNRSFLLLWLAQLISQSAQNAILFTLLVIVTKLTSGSTFTSLLVLSFVVPSIVFGIFSGVLVDLWSKRLLLIYTNLARMLLAVCFLLSRDHVSLLILISIFFATASQLFGTTDAVTVPSVVPKDQLIAANSLFSLAVTGSQLAGMIFLAPILLPTLGEGWLFVIATVMFAISVLCAYFMPPIHHEDDHPDRQMPTVRELRNAAGDYARTLRTLARDPVSSLALVHYATGSSLVLLFAVLVPRYMQAILKVSPDKAVTIFAPVGIGAIIGLRALPLIAARFGKSRTVIMGMCGLAICVLALGLVEPFSRLLQHTDNFNPFSGERAGGLSILVLLTMAFAGPLGFTYALVNAPAQTVLHERAPAEMRGRVFAAQVVLANAVGILPLILAGSVADIFGVSPVLFAIAAVMASIAGVSIFLEARWSTGAPPPPARALPP
ncbi:MAG TPA: MFS transporter [Dehalococcoidia bacterium]|nr:MFS transporter [Dehalococcoidia bacterium]